MAQGFTEHHTFTTLDASTDWDAIFSICQALSLFASRQTLLLQLPENGPNAAMNEQLAKLVALLHDDLLLIVRGNKLTKAQENAALVNSTEQPCRADQLPDAGVRISPAGLPPGQSRTNWSWTTPPISCSAIAMKAICWHWRRRWSDWLCCGRMANSPLPRVEQAVNDAAHFTPFHWVDALLAGKSKRALHILSQLRLEACEPVILLRTVQRELLLLVTLKRQSAHTPLRALFDKHRVWQNRRGVTGEALNRLSADQLRQAVHLLSRIELVVKQDFGQSVWAELESLSLLLCHKALADVFIDG